MKQFSILVNSFNTPKVFKTLLKSWKRHHRESNVKWLISENSLNNETSEMLDGLSIPYFRNVGMKHSDGVDFLIRQCETDYALLIDSDIVFRKNIYQLWGMIENFNFVIAGERVGDRGGKQLHPRVQPWFCFLNVKIIKEKNWLFGDDDICNKGRKPEERIWDVGSKLYNEVIKSGMSIIDMEQDMNPYYFHYEGMSWRKNNIDYYQAGLAVEKAYEIEIENHKEISLKKENNTMDLLTELGMRYNTDKAYAHHYTEEYNQIFESMRFDVKSLLEIGVMRGESIRMWLDYFPNAIISCVDINNLSHLFAGNDRVKFYQSPQSQFTTQEQYDIILDDGSHFMDDQQKTFLNLQNNFKYCYVIEDLQTSLLREYGFTGNNSTIDFLKKLHSEQKIDLNLIYVNGNGSITSVIKKI